MQTSSHTISWRLYLTVTAETLLAFYIAIFSLIMTLTHRSGRFGLVDVIMIILFVAVIVMCALRIVSKLPLQALMIIIPVAPFLALVILLSLIPILQFF